MDTEGVQSQVNGTINGMHSSDRGSSEENMEVEQSTQTQNDLKNPSSGSETKEKTQEEQSS